MVLIPGLLPVTLAVLAVAVLTPAASAPSSSAHATAPPPSEVHDPPARPVTAPPTRPSQVMRFEAIHWRQSRSVGLPWQGRLVAGVRVPAAGVRFYTWDPVLRRSPNPAWRRVGNDRIVRALLRVLAEFAAAHPRAPRIGIGDLSRPEGGDFGVRFGPPGHASHQNGLDVDLYYPRIDRRERPPRIVAQIDQPLAQDLVDRFVRAGASYVFVGPSTGLTGPVAVVQPLTHHDNHLHVRLG